MNIKGIRTDTSRFLSSPAIITKKEASVLGKMIDVMLKDIEILDKGRKINPHKQKIKDAIDVSLMLSNYVLESPLHPKFRPFVKIYSELLYNWNNNTFNDLLIKQLSLYMSRTIDTVNTINGSIKKVKEANDKMKDLAGWFPPSYEINKTYLNQLLDKFDKKINTENSKKSSYKQKKRKTK